MRFGADSNEENIHCHFGGFIDDCRGGGNAADVSTTTNSITKDTTYSKTDRFWYTVGSNQILEFVGDEAKSYDLTFENKANTTDVFLKAEGANALISFKNLNSLVFSTPVEFTNVKDSNNSNHRNPIITSNGGSLVFDSINTVQFGTEDAPLQVDQIIHQNWNGGDVTFKNIGTLNAYAQKTAFLIQSQPNNFAALNINNVDVVNINGGAERNGIQISASAETNLSETYEVLRVSGVKNFNVHGGANAIALSDVSGGTYKGYANFTASIKAENIKLTANSGSGLYAYYTQPTQGKLSVDLSATNSVEISGANPLAVTNSQEKQSPSNVTVSIDAPTVAISSSTSGGAAIKNTSSTLSITSDNLILEGTNAVLLNGTNGANVTLGGSSKDSSVVQANGLITAGVGTSLNFDKTKVQMGDGDNVISQGSVKLSEAVVELNGGRLSVNELNGNNGSIVINKLTTQEGYKTVTVTDNKVADLQIAISSNLNDTFISAQDAAKAVSESISITDRSGSSHEILGQSGALSDAWTADSDGNITSRTTNQSLDALGNYNAMTLVQWRNEVNHISQRLGDVRDSSTTIGAWARVYGYDSSYDDNVSIDFKANSIQAGGDYRINNTWLVGGAFSYTDGEGKFSNGSADSDGYSLAAYLSGFFDCGGYVDFVGRIGRLSTDITAYSDASEFKGSYNNTTFGLSAEVGYHWKLNDTFYVEPQAELAYGFVKCDDFTGANDVRVEQDDFQTLVGRLGARIGASFADGAGTVYAHASVNHDFLGDADYTASLGSVSRDLSVDIGGTWVSYGIGAQFNTSKNLNFYGTLERANGSEYQEDYRYSVGMSYRF